MRIRKPTPIFDNFLEDSARPSLIAKNRPSNALSILNQTQSPPTVLQPVPIPENRQSLANEIRFNMMLCQANRLEQTAKWLGELLITQDDSMNDLSQEDQFMSNENEVYTDRLEGTRATGPGFNKVFFERPSKLQDRLNLARTLFDLKEYRKCAHMLQDIAALNQSALFLKNFALFMVCEQKCEEEELENGDKIQAVAGPSQTATSTWAKELNGIEQELLSLRDKGGLNGMNLYMLGVVLKKKQNASLAREVLIEALNKMPLLWSAWLELSSLTEKESARAEVFGKLESHWVKNFFYASFYLDVQQAKDAIDINSDLFQAFYNSVYVMNQIAHAAYISQQYEIAIDWFKRVLQVDPYRYENLDLFSNILYIKEMYGELANLAFSVFQNDKYRAESCSVIGNYYSLRGDHQMSAIYFMRAIKLDRKFISAWTLMGHEYLEMKNASAAIESYRTALDSDPNDFRAWYGLGQAYEMNRMYGYAIHYYANAALAKPSDSRMWNAMSTCYENLGKLNEAKKCSEKSERVQDKEGIALHKLAKLYVALGDQHSAAKCFRLNLRRKENLETSETAEALYFLARYSKSLGRFEEAMAYAKDLHEGFGQEREEAGVLMREIAAAASQHHM